MIFLKSCALLKRYRQREHDTPWTNADIYREMRERDVFISLFRQTGYSLYLETARRCRNSVNSMIYKAKSFYLKTQLHQNTRNPKKFWRIIRGPVLQTRLLVRT